MHIDFTGLLYAQPSFAEGVGRLIDWGGTLNEYNTSGSPQEADQIAIASDWYAIGDDIWQSMNVHVRTRKIRRDKPNV